MEKQKFISMVQAELDHIKAKATKKEIGKLNMSKLNHNNSELCIYGQMTGNCTTKRARELSPKLFWEITNPSTFERISNGRRPFEQQSFKKGTAFTALEKYLFMVSKSKRDEIIRYLKGKIQTIDLNF